MPRGKAVDLVALQQLLWDRTDRLGRLRLHQRQLAAELGLTYFTVCRIVNGLVADGVLRRIGTSQGNIGRYVVREPDA